MTSNAPARSRPRADPPNEIRGHASFQVLDRTFAILAVFTPQVPEWSATEIAREVFLPIPTVHRILMAIARHGYLRQDPDTKRFRLGPAALLLGQNAHAALDVRAQALPVLRELARTTGETSLLTGFNEEHDRGICVERVESTQPLRLSVSPGGNLPLHAGASQKALGAFLDANALERVLDKPRERICRRTLVDRTEILAEFKRIRDVGWAKSDEETDVGVSGIAMPIFDSIGNVIFAIGVAGPSALFTAKHTEDFVRQTSRAWGDLARAIGARTDRGTLSARPGRTDSREER